MLPYSDPFCGCCRADQNTTPAQARKSANRSTSYQPGSCRPTVSDRHEARVESYRRLHDVDAGMRRRCHMSLDRMMIQQPRDTLQGRQQHAWTNALVLAAGAREESKACFFEKQQKLLLLLSRMFCNARARKQFVGSFVCKELPGFLIHRHLGIAGATDLRKPDCDVDRRVGLPTLLMVGDCTDLGWPVVFRHEPCPRAPGGWSEIRTHGGLAPSAVFKTAALNHSAIHPVVASVTRPL